MKKVFGLSVILSVILASGCASIVNSRTQIVNITTSNGAKVTANVDGRTLQAPGVIGIDRSRIDKVITTQDSNCNPQTMVSSKVDPFFFGNIIIGGLLGSTTDYSTEKMWRYDDTLIIACK
ncbi:MAG: adenosine deaminase [Gammaproteobacteria bacterium]|nr:adenosine deaminase [Gammaproteobacteria bacterium]